MRTFLFALTIIVSGIFNFTLAQEICDNGIDDDGDGLIDLNDTTECICSGVGIQEDLTSMIPNHSFEDYTSLPSNSGQMTNAVGWMQASGATSDYFNLNGTYGDNEINQILPLPDGDGVVGTYVELLDNNSYIEYVGTCLNSPLLAGVDYELVFDIATVVWTSMQEQSPTCAGVTYPDIEMTIFGTGNCANMPFNGVECPIGQNDWQVIGTAIYSPEINEWTSLTININTSIDINGIAIGGPCLLPAGFYPSSYICNAYMFYDDLELHIVQPAGISAEHIGDICEENNMLIAHPDSAAGFYQWYLNGVAIVGETDTILDVSTNNLTSGTYTIMQTIDTACATYDIDIIIGEIPVANFTTDINCTNTLSYFTDSSTVSTGNIATWNWDFNDGITSSQQNPTHTFTTNNLFNVSLTVTTDLGCTDDTLIAIQAGMLDIDTSTINVSCYNGNDGEINIVINSGTAPYTYNWSNGETSQNIENLNYNNYTVTVEDNDACQIIQSFQITQPNQIIITSVIENISCNNFSDGEIYLNMTGGTGAYSFAWDNTTQTTQNITVLSANTYTATVTDGNNCTNTHSVTISNPTQLESIANSTNISCFGNNNGEIDLDIWGGTPPYSYNWSNGDNNQDITNLPNNTYYVTITDVNNCSITNSGIITEPLEISIVENSNTILCHGDQTGLIDISVNGGVNPYTYNWSNLANTEDLNNIIAGIYTVTVTDNSGCPKIQTVTLIEPNELIVSLPDDYTHCNNSTDIEASTEGGTSPYNYLWNTFSETQTVSYQTNQTQTYTVTVTDANNCVTQDEITITIISVSLDVFANNDSVCPGDPVLVTTNIIGGMPPYTVYDNGQISTFPVTIYPNGTENYTLQVVDACGNTDEAVIDINVYPIMPLSFSADILQGCPPLMVHFNQDSYNDNFSYIWNFDDISSNNLSLDQNPVHTFETSGFYDISVSTTDNNGCKNQQTIQNMIEVYPKPDASFEIATDVVSFLNATINFDNYSIGNYNNFWYFDDGELSSIVNPAHEYPSVGTYYPILVVETDKGCLDTAIHQITVQDEFIIYVPTAFSPDHDGINDGFKAVGHGIDLDNYFIAVYDRWGEQIWSSTNLFEEWNGTAKNGDKTAQIGTYKWLVVCKDFNGVEHTRSGNITVIR